MPMQADQEPAVLRRHAQDALISLKGSHGGHTFRIRSDRAERRREMRATNAEHTVAALIRCRWVRGEMKRGTRGI